MKLPFEVYGVFSILAVLAVLGTAVTIYSSGSASFPLFARAVTPGPLSQAHAFLGDNCESCHAPNRGVVAEKCVTCHVSAPELLSMPRAAFHATITECGGCHTEHRGSDIRPIKMDHSMLETVARRSSATPVALQCQTCHAIQDPHQGFLGQQCASCHVSKTWEITTFVHPSPRSTDCAQCHKPPASHLMMHFSMMDQTITGQSGVTVDQCQACHQTDSFNNIKGVGWFDMH